MDFIREFGRRVQLLREARHLSQEQLEDLCTIRQGSISKVENGDHDPKFRTVLAICAGLSSHVGDVLMHLLHNNDEWSVDAVPMRSAEEVTLKEGLVGNHIADRVKGERKRRGLSQQTLADQAGISLSTVQRIEDGDALSHLSKLCFVAKCLGMELNDLLPLPKKAKGPGRNLA